MSDEEQTENPARYALFKALFLRSEGRSQAEAHRLINEYAHELAERIRAEGASWGQQSAAGKVYWAAAGLIDPQEASVPPVRPGEETT